MAFLKNNVRVWCEIKCDNCHEMVAGQNTTIPMIGVPTIPYASLCKAAQEAGAKVVHHDNDTRAWYCKHCQPV